MKWLIFCVHFATSYVVQRRCLVLAVKRMGTHAVWLLFVVKTIPYTYWKQRNVGVQTALTGDFVNWSFINEDLVCVFVRTPPVCCVIMKSFRYGWSSHRWMTLSLQHLWIEMELRGKVKGRKQDKWYNYYYKLCYLTIRWPNIRSITSLNGNVPQIFVKLLHYYFVFVCWSLYIYIYKTCLLSTNFLSLFLSYPYFSFLFSFFLPSSFLSFTSTSNFLLPLLLTFYSLFSSLPVPILRLSLFLPLFIVYFLSAFGSPFHFLNFFRF